MRSPLGRYSILVACLSATSSGCIDDVGETTEATTGASTSEASTSEASTGPEAGCGDGEVVAPEACDDGNQLDGDGCNSDCQISGSMVWCKAEVGGDGPGGANIGNAVATDSLGSAIVVGSVYDSKLGANLAAVVKYASDGSLLWTQRLPDGPRAQGVVIRADDSIVVSTERRVYHMSAAGATVQSSALFEAFAFHDKGLALGPGGSVGFAANTSGLAPRGLIGALHDDLTVRWTRPVDDLGADTTAVSVVANAEGDWLLAGTVVAETIDHGDTGIQEITDGFLRKLDADGALRWSKLVVSPDEEHGLRLTAVETNAADEAVVLGILTNNAVVDAPNMVVTTIAADGQIIGQITLPSGEAAVYGYDLVVTQAGDVVTTGTRWPADDSPAHAFMARHSPSGALQWDFTGALIPARGSDFTAVSEDGAGDLLAAGLQLLEQASSDRILVCKIRR